MANNSETERDVLVTLASTDSSAFLLLYDIYYEKIFYFCLPRLRTKQITEDMTSRVFIFAARNIRLFRGKTRAEFIDWLCTIATAKINHFLRKKEFAELVDKLALDTAVTPDASHKEKLRTKILLAFGRADKNVGRIVLYFTAAAVVLIAAGILFWPDRFSVRRIVAPIAKEKSAAVKAPVNPPPTTKIISSQQQPKSRLEMIKQLADEENVPELLKIVQQGDLPSKLLAAKFLAEITDTNAAEILKLGALPVKTNEVNAVQSVATGKPLTIKIGGIVKNQELEPVKGAEVKVLAKSGNKPENPNTNLLGIFKTDANGIWRCNSFPENASDASIMATHPDYTPPESYQQATAEQLKNFSFETILEKGVTVIGRVVDLQQRPLQATITRGPFHGDSEKEQTCDADGWFRFDNITPGIEIFTVQCAGAAPQVQPVEVKPDMPPVAFTLKPGNIIRGKVVNVSNSPIKDASVAVSTWQGVNSLKFEAKTNDDGFFEWQDAPAEEVLFDIQKDGYASIHNFAMKSGSDYVITLLSAPQISGSVTSSDPDKPVKTFKITPGYYSDNVNISWQDSSSSTFSDNKYELTITEPLDFQLKVQADGFEPAESPVFLHSQENPRYDFVLDPIKTSP
jgi:hypothetical protein